MTATPPPDPGHLLAAGEYFAQYDPLAEEVLADDEYGVPKLEATFRDMGEKVCELLDLEALDLMEDRQFETVLAEGEPSMLLAYGLIAVLRAEMFHRAMETGLGSELLNDQLAAQHEVWSARLLDAYTAIESDGAAPSGRWMN